MIVLDNDVLVEFRRPNPDPVVLSYLQSHRSDPWLVPSVVLYEFLSFYDSTSKQDQERRAIKARVDGIASLDEGGAAEAAAIKSKLSSVGTSLDARDLLIAATARERGGTLATRNKNDFDKQPIHQLMSVDIVR